MDENQVSGYLQLLVGIDLTGNAHNGNFVGVGNDFILIEVVVTWCMHLSNSSNCIYILYVDCTPIRLIKSEFLFPEGPE